APSRFFDEQFSCSTVPRLQFYFEKSLETPCGGVGEIDGCGPHTANGNSHFENVDKMIDTMERVLREIIRKSGCENGFFNGFGARNVQGFSVEKGPFPFFCYKELFG